MLATLGEQVYGELMGHHLVQGFGTAKRPDLALDWFDMGLGAAGATPVFAPGQPERSDLIRQAAYAVGGRAELPAPAAPVPAALPSFAQAAEPAAEPAAVASEPAAVTAAASPSVDALPLAARLPFLLFRN